MDDAAAEVTGAWDHSTLPDVIQVGRDCHLQSPSLFHNVATRRSPGLVIGDRVRIYLGGWGGSFSIGPEGYVEIGDDCVLVGAQLMCRERITIGRGCTISYNVVIADADFHARSAADRRSDAHAGAPDSVPGLPFTPAEARPVAVGDGVHLGINAIVLKGVTIGDGARVEAGAVVTSDVAPSSVVAGNPARPIPS